MTETIAPEPTETQPERPREKNPDRIRPALEALLFSSSRPVSEKDLADVLEATREAVQGALARVEVAAQGSGRGVRLEKVAGGSRVFTRPQVEFLLRRFPERTARSRLSLAAL